MIYVIITALCCISTSVACLDASMISPTSNQYNFVEKHLHTNTEQNICDAAPPAPYEVTYANIPLTAVKYARHASTLIEESTIYDRYFYQPSSSNTFSRVRETRITAHNPDHTESMVRPRITIPRRDAYYPPLVQSVHEGTTQLYKFGYTYLYDLSRTRTKYELLSGGIVLGITLDTIHLPPQRSPYGLAALTSTNTRIYRMRIGYMGDRHGDDTIKRHIHDREHAWGIEQYRDQRTTPESIAPYLRTPQST